MGKMMRDKGEWCEVKDMKMQQNAKIARNAKIQSIASMY
jgi:hypothetical protein